MTEKNTFKEELHLQCLILINIGKKLEEIENNFILSKSASKTIHYALEFITEFKNYERRVWTVIENLENNYLEIDRLFKKCVVKIK